MTATEHEPEACRIARHTLRRFHLEGAVDLGPDIAPPELQALAGVFVSLWFGGDLRGCMGTLDPLMPTAAREIAFVAWQAATTDPTRPPVHPTELPTLEIGVAVLGSRRILADDDHPADDEALEIASPRGRGLALPGCGDDAAVRAAAGIAPDEPVERFAVAVTGYGRQP